MSDEESEEVFAYQVIEDFIETYIAKIVIFTVLPLKRRDGNMVRRRKRRRYWLISRMPEQVMHLSRLVGVSDTDCLSNLRMDRNTFSKLCTITKGIGLLSDSTYVSVEQQLAIFLGVLAHHKKNRVTGFDFFHSGETVSHYLHVVLNAILKIHHIFLAEPTHVGIDSEDSRWKHFKGCLRQGCLGALDGSYFHVTVPVADKPKFRNRKGQIVTNTLACCDRTLRFTYLLPGWEGSAADGRVLRDSISRKNGLKVPNGAYYLCDSGYANSPGFLTPYKGVRYHLKDWGPDTARPCSPVELFNFRHTRARNIIERAFGVLKMRWGILRSPSYYDLRVQVRLIMACFLLQNFMRGEMANDPFEVLYDAAGGEEPAGGETEDAEHQEFIGTVEGTAEWNSFRDDLAVMMWEEYNS